MEKLQKLQEKALVLVCDAHKAIFLTNGGTPAHPELEVADTLEATPGPEPSDRPGRWPDRTAAGAGKGPRSAMERIDPAEQDLARFIAEIAARLERRVQKAPPPAIVIAAGPHLLGELRKHLPDSARKLVRAEYPKDLTHLTVSQIQAAILET